jgi:hypothetical protein
MKREREVSFPRRTDKKTCYVEKQQNGYKKMHTQQGIQLA